jgi:hypothetical protein
METGEILAILRLNFDAVRNSAKSGREETNMSYFSVTCEAGHCKNLRQLAAMEFSNIRFKAEWRRLWNKVSRHPTTLLPFDPIQKLLKDRFHLWRGVQEVPVENIVGSFNRPEQYDRDFRPLNDATRSRWIDVRVLSETSGWKPVILYKLGNLYFVEDGHNRISIARFLRMNSIEARVRDYMISLRFDRDISQEELLEELATYLNNSHPKRSSSSNDLSSSTIGGARW